MAIPSPIRPRPRRVVVIAAASLALVLASGSAARTSATKTIVVNTIADAVDPKPADGVCNAKIKAKGGARCSLRAAIQTANAGSRAGHYTIMLPAGTLHLAVAGKNEGKAAKGDLDVLQADLTVVGKGPAKTAIDGGGIDRVFDVSAFADLSAQGLRITGGKAAEFGTGEIVGGALRVSGTLALENVLVDSNNTAIKGGGLYVAPTGAADLKQVTFSHNVASFGAGVDVEGRLSMTNVTLSGNNAITTGGGIHVWEKGRADLSTSRCGQHCSVDTGFGDQQRRHAHPAQLDRRRDVSAAPGRPLPLPPAERGHQQEVRRRSAGRRRRIAAARRVGERRCRPSASRPDEPGDRLRLRGHLPEGRRPRRRAPAGGRLRLRRLRAGLAMKTFVVRVWTSTRLSRGSTRSCAGSSSRSAAAARLHSGTRTSSSRCSDERRPPSRRRLPLRISLAAGGKR